MFEISCRNLAPKTVGAGKSAVGKRLGTQAGAGGAASGVEFSQQISAFAPEGLKGSGKAHPHIMAASRLPVDVCVCRLASGPTCSFESGDAPWAQRHPIGVRRALPT